MLISALMDALRVQDLAEKVNWSCGRYTKELRLEVKPEEVTKIGAISG